MAPTVAPTAAPASKGPVTLQYFYETGGKPANVAYMDKFFAKYTEANPNVKVEQIVTPSGVTSDQKLETMVAGGTPPDIVYSGATVTMAARGVYLDVRPLLEKSGKSLDEFHPLAVQIYTIKQGSFVWGLPSQLSTHFLVVNKTLFGKAGATVPPTDWADASWTWDAYSAAADKLTVRSGDNVTQWGSFPLDGHLEYCGPYMFGGKWYEGNKCLIDDPKSYKCFQFDHDSIYKSKTAPTPAQSQALEGGFLTGKVAMQVDGPWSIVTYTTIKDFEWTLAAIPYAQELGVKASRLNASFCNCCAIASKTNVDAVWNLMLWMYFDDTNYPDWSWYGTGRLPARLAGQAKWLEYAKGQYPGVAWEVYQNAYDYASPDWNAKQANASKLADIVTAGMLDPVAQDPNANIPQLAATLKTQIEPLLQEV